MLMRGSLRGSGNRSPDNPLEQDQAAAGPASLPPPLLRRDAHGHPPAHAHASLCCLQPPVVLQITRTYLVLAPDFNLGGGSWFLWRSVQKIRDQIRLYWMWGATL